MSAEAESLLDLSLEEGYEPVVLDDEGRFNPEHLKAYWYLNPEILANEALFPPYTSYAFAIQNEIRRQLDLNSLPYEDDTHHWGGRSEFIRNQQALGNQLNGVSNDIESVLNAPLLQGLIRADEPLVVKELLPTVTDTNLKLMLFETAVLARNDATMEVMLAYNLGDTLEQEIIDSGYHKPLFDLLTLKITAGINEYSSALRLEQLLQLYQPDRGFFEPQLHRALQALIKRGNYELASQLIKSCYMESEKNIVHEGLLIGVYLRDQVAQPTTLSPISEEAKRHCEKLKRDWDYGKTWRMFFKKANEENSYKVLNEDAEKRTPFKIIRSTRSLFVESEDSRVLSFYQDLLFEATLLQRDKVVTESPAVTSYGPITYRQIKYFPEWVDLPTLTENTVRDIAAGNQSDLLGALLVASELIGARASVPEEDIAKRAQISGGLAAIAEELPTKVEHFYLMDFYTRSLLLREITSTLSNYLTTTRSIANPVHQSRVLQEIIDFCDSTILPLEKQRLEAAQTLEEIRSRFDHPIMRELLMIKPDTKA